MLYAEWSGTTAKIYNQNKQLVRVLHVKDTIVGVQVSGDSTTEGTVAIAQSNGKTWLYKTSGQLIRK